MEAEAEAAEEMWYVDKEYDAMASEAWEGIGKPIITLQTAWTIFCYMINWIKT
jgi:hypothetical protein